MKLLAPALIAAALALTGCNKDQKAAHTNTNMGAMNTKCPISGGPVSANAGTVSYKGQAVGFCCDGCVGKFDKMSDADKAAKMAGVK